MLVYKYQFNFDFIAVQGCLCLRPLFEILLPTESMNRLNCSIDKPLLLFDSWFIMKSYTASFFKTHFGAVLDRAGVEPVRIERRGRQPAVLIPESEYRRMQRNTLTDGKDPEAALSRLKALAYGPEAELQRLDADLRAAAILRKHS